MCVCKNSDIWSLAIVFQEFIIGYKMSPNLVKHFGLYDVEKQGCLDLSNNNATDFYRIFAELIKGMTQYNPSNRIQLDQV